MARHDLSANLCGHVYTGADVSLAILCDGLFALRIGKGKQAQYVSGLWRLESNDVDLSLINLSHEPIRMAVGQVAIHGTLPHAGHVGLKPAGSSGGPFQFTGMLQKDGQGALLVDEGSGRSFSLPPELIQGAAHRKFATVEAEINDGVVKITRMVSHSAPVPRFYNLPRTVKSDMTFASGVAGKFWVLPPMPGVRQAAIYFSPAAHSKDGKGGGQFTISGPGLRLEGQYEVSGEKLTLKASRASVQNLELIGAGDVAAFFLGELAWSVSVRGLELARDGRKILLTLAS